LSSGGAVYGASTASLIREDHPTRPHGGYGKLKLMMEEALDAAAGSGFGRTILRPANCYGPGQTVKRRQGLMAAIVHCYQTGEPLKVAGDGSIIRDYVFIDDVVSAIVLAIDRAPGNGERINIGSGRGTSILQLIDLCAAITGRRLELAFGPANDGDVPRNVLDIVKAARLLEWKPEVSLEDGVGQMLRAT
jgi:UDP-glucose 4-epimerase